VDVTWVGRLRLYWKPGRVAHLPDYLKVLGVENDTGSGFGRGNGIQVGALVVGALLA
jgi:hypothetical protein